MTIRTQQYALKAYPKIEARIGNNDDSKKLEKKYRTLALTFPTMIMQTGLAQAVGFLLAKGKGEHLAYLEDLAEVLNVTPTNNTARAAVLHDQVIKADLTQYQLLTRQSLEAAAWLKRYTQALLKGE